MARVALSGALLCRSLAEAERVAALLPEHVRLTRAEPGCLRFHVARAADDPTRFEVEELFADAAAFRAHQARTAAARWGRETRGLRRDFTVTGLPRETGP